MKKNRRECGEKLEKNMLVGYLFDDIIDNLDNYRNGGEKINRQKKCNPPMI